MSSDLQICVMAQAYFRSPHPQYNKEKVKKNSVKSKATLFDFGHPEYTSTLPVTLIHPLQTVKCPHLIKLKFWVSLIHRTLTFIKDSKKKATLWLPSCLSQLWLDCPLQSFPLPHLFLASNWKYRTGIRKWPCRDLNLWLKALISCKRPMLSGLGRSKPVVSASQLLLFLLVQGEGFCHLFICKASRSTSLS